MSAQLRYAYLKGHTWLYRRNYPKDVAVVLGTQALKQSLRTGDIATARQRASEVNARYEATVGKVLQGATLVATGASGWSGDTEDPLALLRATLEHSDITPFSRPTEEPKVTVQEASRRYLLERQQDLRPGGFKSVRYSVELFESLNGGLAVTDLGREQGREFLGLIAQLSPVIGKSPTTRGLGLQALVKWSAQGPERITARTQRRIWSQVNHWLDWLVYEGLTEQNPFKTVRFDLKVKQAPYAVPTDQEVKLLLRAKDPMIGKVLLLCLLTGLRAGEAVGLLRSDLIQKGNLGWFVHVRPNSQRLLKTEAAERLVPVHSGLEDTLRGLPHEGPLFPLLSVNDVTKRFSKLREKLGLDRPGLVFHSTRKWFVTQCERTGVPEHFTASLVGHKSARSGNGLTYSIYSAGISDEQKRGIIDQIRLPEC